MTVPRYIRQDEVEARAQFELRRLGLPMSSWDKKESKKDGKGQPKTNRHRGHRNKQTGASARKGKK